MLTEMKEALIQLYVRIKGSLAQKNLRDSIYGSSGDTADWRERLVCLPLQVRDAMLRTQNPLFEDNMWN